MMPIPGAPQIVRIHGADLATVARSAEDTADRLVAVVDADWDSPAGERVSALAAGIPSLLRGVADRYAAAGRAVTAFADRLEGAQHLATRAIREHEDAVAERDAWDRAIDAESADPSPDPVRIARYADARLRAAERVLIAERRHASAVDEVAAADWICTSALRAAAADRLADGTVYRALTDARDVSSRAGDVLGVGALLLRGAGPLGAALGVAATVAGSVELAGDLTLKVVYGDGAWKDIGVNAAWFGVADLAGPVLLRGSQAALHEARHGTRARASALDRLVSGASPGWRGPGRARADVPVTVRRRTGSATPAASATPSTWAARTLRLAELRVARRSGAVAQVYFHASEAVEVTSSGRSWSALTARGSEPVVTGAEERRRTRRRPAPGRDRTAQ